jgi:hypothetical protein
MLDFQQMLPALPDGCAKYWRLVASSNPGLTFVTSSVCLSDIEVRYADSHQAISTYARAAGGSLPADYNLALDG